MYRVFLGPRGLQQTHMDTLTPKKSKSITFTVRGGFFTFWAILAHSVAWGFFRRLILQTNEESYQEDDFPQSCKMR
jgi:hypothetical protein